jgi:hypothetical protein
MTDEFDSYLKKFQNILPVKRHEDNTLIIPRKFGQINAYSLEKQLLNIWCTDLSVRLKKSLLKKLKPYLTEICSDYDDGFHGTFFENNIEAVAKILRVRKKRKLTNEQKTKLQILAIHNFTKH